MKNDNNNVFRKSFENFIQTVILGYAQFIKNSTIFVRLVRFIKQYCHNPTNNPRQLKTTFVGVVLKSVKKPHHTTPPPHHNVITIRAVPGNLVS